ncbi:MAG: DUF106 domain-containing protein [Halobacteriaceae archaeon]
MPAEQLAPLLDDPATREALAVVLERSDGGAIELQYSDVRDAMTGAEWGRLLESGVLVGGESGFRPADPERLERELGRETDEASNAPGDDEATDPPGPDDPDAIPGDAAVAGQDGEDDLPSTKWAWYDKLAAVGSLALVGGEINAGLRNVIGPVYDAVLHPVSAALPFYAVVVVLAIVTGVYSVGLQAKLRDTEVIRAYQDRMERLKERKAAAEERGDDEALDAIQEEQLDAATDQFGMLKAQFRPMVWIMLLTISVYIWLRWAVRGGHLAGATGMVLPFTGHVTWQQSLLGPMPTWIVWYFLCSMAARQIIQKSLGVQTSPTS